MSGLRERKKARTRTLIATTAAGLFARDGFRAVTMIEVARAAEVSEQTVYNHFPTKESLVFDQAGDLRQALLDATGESGLHDGYASWVRSAVLGESAQRAVQNPGGMPRLVAADSGLRRHLLDLANEWATALAVQVTERGQAGPVVARTLCDALLQVFVRAVDRLGVIETGAELHELEADVRQALEVLRRLSDR